MNRIPFGIWVLQEDGISCSERIHRNSFIGNHFLNNLETTVLGSVWEYPVHFARKTWTTHEVVQDLMTALAVQRAMLGLEQQPAVDERTWIEVLKIIEDRE